MKNAPKLIATISLSLFLSAIIMATPVEDLNRTIILINGAPFLVDMDQDGGVIETIAAVPYYFKSSEPHASMIDRISEEYKSELSNIKSRLLVFQEDRAILDFIAIDHIRDMARLYSKGFIETINISAAHSDDHDDEALAAHRINTIYQMLKDFGVDDQGISADMKHYKSDLPNQFVRLNIE